jgi:hypothetical protein
MRCDSRRRKEPHTASGYSITSRNSGVWVEMTASNRKYHRGIGVDLWTDRGAWFWQLAGHCCGAGTVGSALTENEALREAYEVLEEVFARCARAAPGRVSSAATTVISHHERDLAAKLASGAKDFGK